MMHESSDMQALLNMEANFSNNKQQQEADQVRVVIKLKRGSNPPPCWSEDDCSTSILIRCPWRIDCGSEESIDWWNKNLGI